MWKADEIEDLEEKSDFKPIPDGAMCEVVVAEAHVDVREADGGKKTKYKVTFVVAEGDHQNRKIWESYNISGHSENGDKIGNGIFKRFALSLGVTSFESLSELVGKSLVVRVGVKTERDGKMWNRVKSYYPMGEANADAPNKSQNGGAWKKPEGAQADW